MLSSLALHLILSRTEIKVLGKRNLKFLVTGLLMYIIKRVCLIQPSDWSTAMVYVPYWPTMAY